MDSLSQFALQIAFRSCPCNESKKDCSGEHGKVELLIKADASELLIQSETKQAFLPQKGLKNRFA